MTLTTHAVVGAAAASLVPQYPVLGFVLGFGSHFLIDSIPHWAEGAALLRSVEKEHNDPNTRRVRVGKDLVHDVAVIGADSLLGFALATILFAWFLHIPLYIVLMGAFAGQMPDGLQFLYFLFKPKFMTPLQTFHSRIQTEYKNYAFLGIEVCVMVVAVLGIFVLQ